MSVPPVLVEVIRGGILESAHRGWVAVARADGTLVASCGDPDRVTYPRSAMKPFQAVAMVETGAADRFGFTAEELAVACASHSGEPRHRSVVDGVLRKCGQPPSAMLNGVDPPWSAGDALVHVTRSRNPLAPDGSDGPALTRPPALPRLPHVRRPSPSNAGDR
jgi:L-asparaginase II